MDLNRPSAKHRVSAWRGAVQRCGIIHCAWPRTHVVSVYDKSYIPPGDSAVAITTNAYLMLGTQLGFPGLVCFVTYVALRLRSPKPKVQSPKSGNGAALDFGPWTLDSTKVACRAGAVVLLVAFWFDGGLFKLATASVVRILLELGSLISSNKNVTSNSHAPDGAVVFSICSSAATPRCSGSGGKSGNKFKSRHLDSYLDWRGCCESACRAGGFGLREQ